MELQLTPALLRLDKKCGKSGIADNRKCSKTVKTTSPEGGVNKVKVAGAVLGGAVVAYGLVTAKDARSYFKGMPDLPPTGSYRTELRKVIKSKSVPREGRIGELALYDDLAKDWSIGDLVYYRGAKDPQAHFGVYAGRRGEGQYILNAGVQSDKGGKVSGIISVNSYGAQGGLPVVWKKVPDHLQPKEKFDPISIRERLSFSANRPYDFDLVENNCEAFARMVVSGQPRSVQVERFSWINKEIVKVFAKAKRNVKKQNGAMGAAEMNQFLEVERFKARYGGRGRAPRKDADDSTPNIPEGASDVQAYSIVKNHLIRTMKKAYRAKLMKTDSTTTVEQIRADKKCGKSAIPDNRKCSKRVVANTVAKVALGAGLTVGVVYLASKLKGKPTILRAPKSLLAEDFIAVKSRTLKNVERVIDRGARNGYFEASNFKDAASDIHRSELELGADTLKDELVNTLMANARADAERMGTKYESAFLDQDFRKQMHEWATAPTTKYTPVNRQFKGKTSTQVKAELAKYNDMAYNEINDWLARVEDEFNKRRFAFSRMYAKTTSPWKTNTDSFTPGLIRADKKCGESGIAKGKKCSKRTAPSALKAGVIGGAVGLTALGVGIAAMTRRKGGPAFGRGSSGGPPGIGRLAPRPTAGPPGGGGISRVSVRDITKPRLTKKGKFPSTLAPTQRLTAREKVDIRRLRMRMQEMAVHGVRAPGTVRRAQLPITSRPSSTKGVTPRALTGTPPPYGLLSPGAPRLGKTRRMRLNTQAAERAAEQRIAQTAREEIRRIGQIGNTMAATGEATGMRLKTTVREVRLRLEAARRRFEPGYRAPGDGVKIPKALKASSSRALPPSQSPISSPIPFTPRPQAPERLRLGKTVAQVRQQRSQSGRRQTK